MGDARLVEQTDAAMASLRPGMLLAQLLLLSRLARLLARQCRWCASQARQSSASIIWCSRRSWCTCPRTCRDRSRAAS